MSRSLPRGPDAATVTNMTLHVETDLENDGRWIGAVRELPGVLVYADTRDGAVNGAVALALRVLAERAESGEPVVLPITLALVA